MTSKTQQHIDTLIDLRLDKDATKFVMEFYGIDEKTAVKLYNDEIDAAKSLLQKLNNDITERSKEDL